jgi:hypothetical protein
MSFVCIIATLMLLRLPHFSRNRVPSCRLNELMGGNASNYADVPAKFATGLDACETEPKAKNEFGIRAVFAEANAQAALPLPVDVLRHERKVQVSRYLVELGINARAVDGRFDIVPPVSKCNSPAWVSETKQLQALNIVGKPIHLISPL